MVFVTLFALATPAEDRSEIQPRADASVGGGWLACQQVTLATRLI